MQLRLLLMTCICLFCTVFTAPVQAENYKYSVVTIENHSPYRVYYSYRWGDGNQSWRNSIGPNESFRHWWTFDYTNENWAPWFYVKIDGQSGWHELGSFFSEDTEAESGKLYRFIYDASEERFTLQEWLYSE
jgi:hypothetical protein